MTDTPTTEQPAPSPNDKGLPPGVTNSDTGEGDRGEGAPQAPVINNAPPPKEPAPEDKAKEEADKRAADEAAAKEAEDKAKQEEPAKKDDQPAEELTEYPDYGDDNANAVVAILKDANIPVAEAHTLFKDAIESGDFTKINMATLTEKLGKAKADLVMLGVKSYYTNFTASVKETVTAVHNEVGGEGNFRKVQAWARAMSDKDPAFREKMDGFNQMFDLNKTAAVMAAKELASLYEKDAGNSSLIKKQVHGDRAASSNATDDAYLTRRDYLDKMKVAQDRGDVHEINRLRTLRTQSRNK